MSTWCWWAWQQVWPNLAGNVLWVPVAGVHHWLTRRHIRTLHSQHREMLDRALNERRP